ncbi:MAG: hypothetical protein M3O32_01240 [Actinomycetota bacterium]|nr:hypothetical protein [Actinomycetota bacterium]
MPDPHDFFEIGPGPEHVRLWATRPLPFEPKDWQLQLRAALLGLQADGRSLAVQFWDRDRRVHDLENAVTYNVGLAPFTRHLQAGLILRRRDVAFLPPRDLPGEGCRPSTAMSSAPRSGPSRHRATSPWPSPSNSPGP